MRRLAEPGAKLLDQPRLADAGLADHKRELALAFARALPTPTEQIELLLASDERRQRSLTRPTAGAARADDAIERQRRCYALERMRAAVLRDKQPGGLPLHGRSNEDGARFGHRLDPRGDVRRLTEHLAGRVDHQLP